MQLSRRQIIPLLLLILVAIAGIFIISKLTSNQSPSDSSAATNVKTVLTLSSPATVSNLSVGSPITVSLSLQNTTNVNVGEIVLSFDPAVLGGVSISESSAVLALNKSINNTTGKITIDIAKQGSGDLPENSTLVDFGFALGNASATSTIISTSSDTTLGSPNLLASTGLGSLQLVFQTATCGDGIIQSPNNDGTNEQCDNGANNGVVCNPGSNASCQYCTNSCIAQIVQANPSSPAGDTTVTCYRCTSIITDGNVCESFSATNTCPANSSTSSTGCAAAVGGSCTTTISGEISNPNNSNTSGTSTSLPNTGILDNGVDILLGFLFVILGITVYKYYKNS